jgi:hypothetical protein
LETAAVKARGLILIVGIVSGCVHRPLQRGPDRVAASAIDFTAVDEFWRVQALLAADREPSAAEWQRLLGTPGYRLAWRVSGDALLEDLRIAFEPSRRTVLDSVTKLGRARGLRLMHLQRAALLRPQLDAFRDSVVRSALTPRAVAMAARFLPPGATDHGDPPIVAFAIFADDGYSFGDSILVDLLHASQSDLTLFLAHEFHHTYVERLASKGANSNSIPADRELRAAIENLRKEGIADLIDKPYPVSLANPALAAYTQKYNEEYVRTPTTLAIVDSLLRGPADDTLAMTEAGKRVKSLLWSSGHANGAYMAREILETFGVDSLFPAVRDPAAFIRTFNVAEAARGRAPVLSRKAMQVLEMLERRYWSRDTTS